MNKFVLGIITGMLIIFIQNLYLKPYEKGYVQSCIDIHTDWYKRLEVRVVDKDALKRFCENKLK